MSFAEVLEELSTLTFEQRQLLIRRAIEHDERCFLLGVGSTCGLLSKSNQSSPQISACTLATTSSTTVAGVAQINSARRARQSRERA